MESRYERTRMKRPALEAAFDKASGVIPEYCQVCRGPHMGTFEVPAVVLHDDEQLGTCPACDREVGPDGRSALVATSTGIVRRAVFRIRGPRCPNRGRRVSWS